MFKLNNKGQSLVMFIIIIPIFLLIITLVYDVGTAIYEKNRLSNTALLVVDYGLDNIDDIEENDLIDFIKENDDNLDYISVVIEDDVIEIKLSKKIKGIIGKMFNFDIVDVNVHYNGKLVQGKKEIERTW